MIRIGLIGAESTHAEAFIRQINSHTGTTDCRITALWGETQSLAEKLVKRIGQSRSQGIDFPDVIHGMRIVRRQEDMHKEVDAVIIAQRHGGFHLTSASIFLEDRIPVFIDKPLCTSSEQGINYLLKAELFGIPVTSFSILQFQSKTKAIKEQVEPYISQNKSTSVPLFHIYGPEKNIARYGGLFFYGIHHVLLAGELFGRKTVAIRAQNVKDGLVAELRYEQGFCVMLHFISCGYEEFSIGWDFLEVPQTTIKNQKNHTDSIKNPDQWTQEPLVFDNNRFREPIRIMLNMFKTKQEPFTHEELLWPIRVLEAIITSHEQNSTLMVSTSEIR